MSSKLGKPLPLFINSNIQECQVVSGLLHNFTHVKVKEVCPTEWTLHLKKNILLAQKCYCEVGIIIAINVLLKLAVSSIQYLKSNR